MLVWSPAHLVAGSGGAHPVCVTDIGEDRRLR
jgi:hypothetical protein